MLFTLLLVDLVKSEKGQDFSELGKSQIFKSKRVEASYLVYNNVLENVQKVFSKRKKDAIIVIIYLYTSHFKLMNITRSLNIYVTETSFSS